MNNNFHVTICPIQDQTLYKQLMSYNSIFSIYGNFEIYKNDYQEYEANSEIKIILSSNIKKAYVLCQGKMILYGRVSNMYRKSLNKKSSIIHDKTQKIRSINQEIDKLKNKKKEIYLS